MTDPRKLAKQECQRLDMAEVCAAFSRAAVAISRLGPAIERAALDVCEQMAAAFPDDDIRSG